MTEINELRSEMWAACERLRKRRLTEDEKTALVSAYNSHKEERDYYERCKLAIWDVLNIDLGPNILFEKSGSVDRVLSAINNLRAVAAANVPRK